MSLEELWKKRRKTSHNYFQEPRRAGRSFRAGPNPKHLENSHRRLLNCAPFKLKSCVQLSNKSVIWTRCFSEPWLCFWVSCHPGFLLAFAMCFVPLQVPNSLAVCIRRKNGRKPQRDERQVSLSVDEKCEKGVSGGPVSKFRRIPSKSQHSSLSPSGWRVNRRASRRGAILSVSGNKTQDLPSKAQRSLPSRESFGSFSFLFALKWWLFFSYW